MAKGMHQRGCSYRGSKKTLFPQPNSLTLSRLLSSGWKSIEHRGTSLVPVTQVLVTGVTQPLAQGGPG